MSEPNPFLLRLRERQGRWGAFHRSNAMLVAVALVLHATVAFTLYRGGWDVAMLVFIAFNAMVLLLGSVGVVSTIRHQVRAARRQRIWDELLITPLTSKQIVNGQLLLASRPAVTLLWLSTPSQAALIGALVWSWAQSQGPLVAVTSGLVVVVLAAAAYAGASLCVLTAAVIAFKSALSTRGFISRTLINLGWLLLLIAVPALLVALPPVAWYDYRRLVVSLRERLLEEDA